MKKKLEKLLGAFLGGLIGTQFLLQLIGISYFSKNGNPIFLNISLIISVSMGIIIYSKIQQKEASLNEKIKTTDYFRNLDFKEIKPIEAGILTKKSKMGFNSILIIIFELIEKNILVNRHHNNKMYISLKNNITLEEIEKLPEEEKKIIKIIFTGTGDRNEYEINQIIDNIKSDVSKSQYLNLILNEIKYKISRKYLESHYFAHLNTPLATLMIFIIVIPFSLIIPTIIIATTQSVNIGVVLMFILYIINLTIFIYFMSKKIPKNKYINEIKKLNGLYNFLNDFSNIKNLDIKYIEIYDKYYLYALGLGLTNKIEKQYDFNSIDNNLKSNFKYLFYIEQGEEKND